VTSEDRLIPTESDLADSVRVIIECADLRNPAQNTAAIEFRKASRHLVAAPGFLPSLPNGDMQVAVRVILDVLLSLPVLLVRRDPYRVVVSHVCAAAESLGVR
jgi:hypothetical protein